MDLLPLPTLETRVLGVLVEKQHVVPDSYPLTLNALTAGCNQKTSRDPLLDAAVTDVQAALDELRSRSLVMETSGGRVMRYAHNMERALAVPSQAVAALATLMLRGPQTLAELRLNCERLHRFADISALHAFMVELETRAAGPLVRELPRQPGSRETRWAHLLSGPPAMEQMSPGDHRGDAQAAQQPSDIAGLTGMLAHLQDELEALKNEVAELRSELARDRAAGPS